MPNQAAVADVAPEQVWDEVAQEWIDKPGKPSTTNAFTGVGKGPIIEAVEEEKRREASGEVVRDDQAEFYADWGFDHEPHGDGSRQKPWQTIREAEFRRRRNGRMFLVRLPIELRPPR